MESVLSLFIKRKQKYLNILGLMRIIILIFLPWSVFLNAQKKWTLNECITYAYDNNISIKQANLDLKISEIDKQDAVGDFLPRININTNANENTGLNFNPVTNNAQTTTLFSASGSINVRYTLFNGLQNIRNVQKSTILKLASLYNLDKIKEDTAIVIANSYLQILLNKENLKSLKNQNSLTKSQILRTQELINAGVLPKGDIFEILATDANEQQNIITTENNVQMALINLALDLNIEDYVSFDISEENFIDNETSLEPYSIQNLLNTINTKHPNIKIAEQNLKIAQKNLQIAKGAYWPSLSAFFSYNTRYVNTPLFLEVPNSIKPTITRQIGTVMNTGEVVVSEFPNTSTLETNPDPFINQLYQNDGISYGLSLDIPVFNGLSIKRNVKKNFINIKHSKLQLEQVKLDLERLAYQAYFDTVGTLKALQAAKFNSNAQKLAFNNATNRYKEGLMSVYDYCQSKLRYNNAIIAVNTAKYDYVFKLKVLKLYFGVPQL